MREQTYSSVAHPDPLNTGSRILTLIEDPVADRISKGDPTLGWEGDPRMALYIDYNLGTWELWRLENDNVYRQSYSLPTTIRGTDVVGMMVLWLVESDSRRGFDLVAHVDKEMARWDKQVKEREEAFAAEGADRMAHALQKDGVL